MRTETVSPAKPTGVALSGLSPVVGKAAASRTISDFAEVFTAAKDSMDGKILPVLPDVPANTSALGSEITDSILIDGVAGLDGSILPVDDVEERTSTGVLEGWVSEDAPPIPVPQASVSVLATKPLPDDLRPSVLSRVQPAANDRTDASKAADISDAPTLHPEAKPAPSRTERAPLHETAAMQMIALATRGAISSNNERSGAAPAVVVSIIPVTASESATSLVQPGVAPISVIAPLASSVISTDQSRDFAALMNRLVQAREATGSSAASTARIVVPHAEFGGVTMRFDTHGGNVTVGISSADPGFAPAIRAALSDAHTGDPSQRNAQGGQNGGGHQPDQRGAHTSSYTQSQHGNSRDNRTAEHLVQSENGILGVSTLRETPSRDGLYI